MSARPVAAWMFQAAARFHDGMAAALLSGEVERDTFAQARAAFYPARALRRFGLARLEKRPGVVELAGALETVARRNAALALLDIRRELRGERPRVFASPWTEYAESIERAYRVRAHGAALVSFNRHR